MPGSSRSVVLRWHFVGTYGGNKLQKKEVENDVAMTKACNESAAIGCRSCLSAPPSPQHQPEAAAPCPPQEGGGRMRRYAGVEKMVHSQLRVPRAYATRVGA